MTGDVLPGVPRTILASGKTASILGWDKEPLRGETIGVCGEGFKEYAVYYLGSLESACPQIKQESYAKVVGWSMKPRRRSAVWDYWEGFSEC